MALKTQPTAASVDAFLDAIPDATRRADCRAVAKLMRKATGQSPQMWGATIVGFGTKRYRYATGREGDWFEIGFAPRKNDLTLYILPGVQRYPALLKKLGKHKTGVGCLYLKKLADVDLGVLTELIEASVKPGATGL